MTRGNQRTGLILLVVLGMLSLFSMLAITYVVFAGQLRTSNLSMVRRDFRGTPPAKLLDEASRQILRGTTDRNSVMWRQGLLGDLYGSGAIELPVNGTPVQSDRALDLVPRTNRRDNPARVGLNWLPPSLPLTRGSLEGPQIVGDTFLKVPLQWQEELPEQHDVWNGRVVSFRAGPLARKSFRIVRYFGQMPGAPSGTPPPDLIYRQSLQYSLVIDLSSVLDESVTVGMTTRPLADWLTLASSNNGATLCYQNVPSSGPLMGPYAMMVNAAPLNAYGSGVALNAPLLQTTTPTLQMTDSALEIAALSHLPLAQRQLPGGVYRDIAVSLLQNYSHTARFNADFQPIGDLDEPYDAADATDFHLAYRQAGATTGDGIIPSFHRPAVINHVFKRIVDAKALQDFSLPDLFATIELLQRASGRPLSYRVRNVPSGVSSTGLIAVNADFSGSNRGAQEMNPQLDVNWSNWSEATERAKFESWVRWLIRGPWDADTDGDGVNDAVWVDINLPLSTSPEGKLLKVLAAFYVEDLGGRLDLNATGNLAQADATFNNITGDNRFAMLNNSQLPQGLGFGTADISLRHLFTSDADYLAFLRMRYGASRANVNNTALTFGPGIDNADDPLSQLRQRHRLPNHNQNRMPGLPMSVFGKTGLGIDLLGNLINFDASQRNQNLDDPYEARQLTTAYRDRPITFAEWERLERMYDLDRSKLDKRFEKLVQDLSLPADEKLLREREVARAVTPQSRATIAAKFATLYFHDRMQSGSGGPTLRRIARRVGSFVELVEALAQQRFVAVTPPPDLGTYPYFSQDRLKELFPIEFFHNLPLDVNRPFGNGLDDNNNGLIDEPMESVGHGFDDNDDGLVDAGAELGAFPARHQRAEYVGGLVPNVVEQYTLDASKFDPVYESIPDNAKRDDGLIRYGGNQGRQLLARHLYCLAQLLLPDDYIFPNQADPTTPLPYGTRERARILAQWAINVVDFRDMDGTMTRFPYDAEPFDADGWVPDDGVVWGYEEPELLLTESFAFHDIRINRKENPPAGQNEWQQLRIPEGSLFLEFLGTASSDPGSGLLPGRPRGNLYAQNASTSRLELNVSATTPADNNGNQFPVWRVLLLDPHDPAAGPGNVTRAVTAEYADPASRAGLEYQFASDAGLPWRVGSSEAPPVNRLLWFADLDPTPDNMAVPAGSTLNESQVYRNRAGGVSVLGGQYLVVGPREVTYIGQRQQTDDPPLHRPNPHRVELTGNWVQWWNEMNHAGLWLSGDRPAEVPNGEPVPQPSNFISNCVTMVATAAPPIAWMENPRNIGLNISEPNPGQYYPEPIYQLNAEDDGVDPETGAPGFGDLPPDAYVDLEASPMGNSEQDEPLDSRDGEFLSDFGWQPEEDGMGSRRPHVKTQKNWSTAILQRLANPDAPWHAALNPYITVDWMPIDLTVFNGEETITPDDDVYFASRQKTGASLSVLEQLEPGPAPRNDDFVLTDLPMKAGRTHYSYHSALPQVASVPATTMPAEPPFFNYSATLEYIDRPMETDQPLDRLETGTLQNIGQFVTLGYLNSRYGLRGMRGEAVHNQYPNAIVYYEGGQAYAPTAPAITNRDFVNAYELLSVPLSAPGRMLQEFTAAASVSGGFAFEHLLDFDMVDDLPNGDANMRSASALLELVQTRNPWSDAESVAHPMTTRYVPPSSASAADFLRNEALSIYRAPFNRISRFVEPGKVNLNTASDEAVLRGLMWSAITPATDRNSGAIPYQDELAASLYPKMTPGGLSDGHHMGLDAGLPTRFPGVFRSAFGANVFPYQRPPQNNTTATGLLRATAPPPSARVFSPTPLLGTAQPPYNPMVLNYPVSRLGNLTTSSSDVYAVRVMLGYFEYVPRAGATLPLYPSVGDLGREYGEDEGKVQRHRAFYVIDRSIPVGYREGEDFNTDNCILVRRVIE